MRVVFFNVLSSAEATGVVEVLQRGKRTANDPLSSVDDLLYSLSLCLSTAAIPYCDTVCQQALHCRAIEGLQQLLLQVVLLQHSQEVKALLCLLDNCCGVGRPCEIR